MSKRKMKVLLVSPEMAERWLNQNTHNRPLRNHLVDKYAEAMKRGEWKLTPEPIAFSSPFTDATGDQTKETLINEGNPGRPFEDVGVAEVIKQTYAGTTVRLTHRGPYLGDHLRTKLEEGDRLRVIKLPKPQTQPTTKEKS